jgi:hypothetical protein
MIEPIHVDVFLKEKKALEAITSHQIYFDKSMNFHPQGLYSETIFGVEGSKERRSNYSWIDLNCNVVHPFLYDILEKRIFRRIPDLLSGEAIFSLDSNNNLVEDDMGDINGMTAFVNNIHKIRFSTGEEGGDRNKIIDVLYKAVDDRTFFINKLPVISPEYRPIQIDEITGDIQIDDLTKLYQKIIMAGTQLGSVSGQLFDIFSYRMQLFMRDLYELVKVKVSKKEGLIRNHLLGKRVDYSARAVITPNYKLKVGNVGVPLRLACQLFEPYLIYGIINSPYKSMIPDEFHIEVKKFLSQESDLLEDD